MLLNIPLYRRTDNVDLKIVLARPLESVLRQSRCESLIPHFFRNFGMDQFEDVS